MTNKKKILLVYGTRPEAIKMAPLYHQLRQDKMFDVFTCVTAQHRSMLDSVLLFFDIKPDYDLDLMKKDQTLFDVTSNILTNIQSVFEEVRPDVVLVHGDTTTAMTSALAAFYGQFKVGHVEAGLRTHDITSPFPEELNRQIISRIANFHFAPTLSCKDNISNEFQSKKSIEVTGNTVIDALYWTLKKINSTPDMESSLDNFFSSILNLDIKNIRYILITGHRRENFGKSFIEICEAIRALANKYPEIHFIYPVHLNPNVQKPAHKILNGLKNVHLIEPLDYKEFVYLMNHCYFILTDSGGIQEEAPSLKKPVLVMRETTERPEAIESGGVKLVGSDQRVIVKEASILIDSKEKYLDMCIKSNPYGDGSASNKINIFLKDNL